MNGCALEGGGFGHRRVTTAVRSTLGSAWHISCDRGRSMTQAVEHAGPSTASGPALHEGNGPLGKALEAARAWREAVGNWLTCELERRALTQAPERADALVRARVLLTEAERTVRQPKPDAAAVLALAREALRWCLAAAS